MAHSRTDFLHKAQHCLFRLPLLKSNQPMKKREIRRFHEQRVWFPTCSHDLNHIGVMRKSTFIINNRKRLTLQFSFFWQYRLFVFSSFPSKCKAELVGILYNPKSLYKPYRTGEKLHSFHPIANRNIQHR